MAAAPASAAAMSAGEPNVAKETMVLNVPE